MQLHLVRLPVKMKQNIKEYVKLHFLCRTDTNSTQVFWDRAQCSLVVTPTYYQTSQDLNIQEHCYRNLKSHTHNEFILFCIIWLKKHGGGSTLIVVVVVVVVVAVVVAATTVVIMVAAVLVVDIVHKYKEIHVNQFTS